jgi:hypothetical protein
VGSGKEADRVAEGALGLGWPAPAVRRRHYLDDRAAFDLDRRGDRVTELAAEPVQRDDIDPGELGDRPVALDPARRFRLPPRRAPMVARPSLLEDPRPDEVDRSGPRSLPQLRGRVVLSSVDVGVRRHQFADRPTRRPPDRIGRGHPRDVHLVEAELKADTLAGAKTERGASDQPFLAEAASEGHPDEDRRADPGVG